MFKFLKKTKTIKNDLFSFKNEPLTSASIFFLIILDIFIFVNINIGVDAETSKSPKAFMYYPSSCSTHFLTQKDEYHNFSSKNYYSNKNNKSQLCLELDAQVKKITATKEFKHNKDLHKSLKKKLKNNTIKIDNISKNYNTQLFEKIASLEEDEKLKRVQKNYRDLQEKNQELQTQLDSIAPLTSLIGYAQYKSFIEKNKADFKTKSQDYRYAQPFYEFAHLLVFILPILIISLLIYLSVKKKELHNKPYNAVVKIISVHISVLLSLPLIFYTLNLVYHVIPKTLLKNIVEFFVSIGLISVLNYMSIFIAVFIFGYIIYYLQKRSAQNKKISNDTNKHKNIALSKCPKCLNKVDFSKPFCPHCSNKLLIECTECHKQTIKDLNYCQHCASTL
jgi:hypothetical protein